MKLINDELKHLFEQYPIGSQDGKLGEAKVLAKFFNPSGAGTWIITEGEQIDNGDYEMFGYCHLGDDTFAELGYVMLSELENVDLPYGLNIERDLHLPKNLKLAEAIEREGFEVPKFLLIDKEEMENDELEM